MNFETQFVITGQPTLLAGGKVNMPQVVFNEEWIVAAKLSEKTGLTERQIKALRSGVWIEGIHFKRQSVTGGETQRGLLWYNLPQINRLIQEL